MNITIITPPKGFKPGQDLADPLPPDFCPAQFINDFIAKIPQQKSMADCVLSTEELADLDIPPREYFIEPFLPVRSLLLLYATRGIGKTWFAMQAAISIATGTDFLAYKLNRQGRVLIVDGEMVLSDQQSRFKAILNGISPNISLMPSELLHQNEIALNLHDYDHQERFIECLCELEAKEQKFDVLIFDNLSSLTSGKDENDNTEMEGFQSFLIRLRHMGYTVIIVHHAGKSGDQRGASKREDIMDTVIKLRAPELKAGDIRHDDAHFVMEFTKTRGATPKPFELDAKLIKGPSGKLEWSFNDVMNTSRADDVLKVIGELSPDTQKAIVEHMCLNKATVSGHIKSLVQSGYIKSSKGLGLTDAGVQRLLDLWPSEFSKKFLNKEMPF